MSALWDPPPLATDTEPPVSRSMRMYRQALGAVAGCELRAVEPAPVHHAVGAAMYHSPPHHLRVPALPVARLTVNLTPSAIVGGIEGEGPRRFDAKRYSLFLTPARVPVVWQKHSPSRHLDIYFEEESWPRDVEQGVEMPLPRLSNAMVSGLHPLVDDLVTEMQTPRLLSGEAADSLCRLLLIHVARDHVRAASPSVTPAMVERLRDYVHAHLTERVRVAELARELGLPANRFAVDFVRLTGQPPYRFVLGLRLERATRLLATSSHSLTEVALECGFASQQHLSNAIRRHTGLTPSRYRLLHRGPPFPAKAKKV